MHFALKTHSTLSYVIVNIGCFNIGIADAILSIAMKTKHIQLKVTKDNISFIADPQGHGHDAYYGFVRVGDLPLDLPLDINPRSQNLHSRVARQIQNGLLEESENFHLLNRGMTITAIGADYDAKKSILDLEVAGGYYGVLDGGHTYSVIRKNIEPFVTGANKDEPPSYMDAFVRIEVLTGVKSDLLVDIAQSRNTSAQVHDESLANLEGSFDWLKEVFADTKFGKLIAYRENEDDSIFPIDVREVVSLLTLFHPKFADSENPPIMGYASKGRCLELFRTEPNGFKSLRNIAVDVLELYDYIHLQFAPVYEKIGGLMGSGETDERKSKSVKLAKVTGVKKIDSGFDLYYLGRTANYRFSDGWLFPVVAAMRGIVGYRTDVARWKAKPQEFFDGIAKQLVKATLDTSKDLGRNPNAVGKSRPHWMALHEKVINTYLRKVTADTERDV